MHNNPHIRIAIAFAVLVAIGAVQGQRLDSMRESELFYRWMLNAATLMRIDGSIEFEDTAATVEPMDDELFAQVEALAEERFPEYEIDEDYDVDFDGNPYSKLIRAARIEADEDLYSLASASATSELRGEFISYLNDGLLQSAGSQFSTSSLYAEDTLTPNVGVSSLFFGFRKLAANFIWLQVDKFWHLGQMHRMVPLMRTCVTLDPSFVDAYLLGAWHLAYNLTAKLPDTPEGAKEFHEKYKKRLGYKEEWYYIGADFLKDGIRKNPRDYRLYFDLGYSIYENKLEDHPNAIRYLDEARRHRHDRWVPRMLYLAYMRNGQYEDAIEGWKDYIEKFPDNPTAGRSLQLNQGLLHEALHREATQCARAAEEAMERYQELAKAARGSGDDAKAATYTAEAERAEETWQDMEVKAEIEKADALAIWEPMIRRENDPYARARVLRFQALDYAEENRHLEAVGVLEAARWELSEFFDEASDLIIEFKQDGDIALTVSEQLRVERLEDESQTGIAPNRTPDLRRLECDYLDSSSENTTVSKLPDSDQI